MDKQDILNEIKRTAKANGNVPIGHRKFFQETGIEEGIWKGKYWARWGDAVRDAGFEPNRLKVAYDENYLIEKFISLTRDLGRFPVTAEIRMKVRSDPDFPNDKTFARLGSTKQLRVVKILEYSKGREGMEDIQSLFTAILNNQPTLIHNEEKFEECSGIVYLMKSGRNYKIGFTNNLARREREIKIKLPDKLETIHWFRTDDASGIEAYWKNRFRKKCKNGEWFDLKPQDIKAFKRRKTFM